MEPLLLTKRERRKLASEYAELCLTCGTCAGGCPVTGVDGLDVRKAVRLAVLGLDQELIDSKFPWVCTLCGRCEHACPMGIDLLVLLRSARGMRARDRVPGSCTRASKCASRTGNNVGIPKDDFVFLLQDLGAELAERTPRVRGPHRQERR